MRSEAIYTTKYYELDNLITRLRELADETMDTEIHCLAVDMREAYDNLVAHYGLSYDRDGYLR